ncbi:MAG: DUF2071 domain-containing protein [Planctomycetales bacterium]
MPATLFPDIDRLSAARRPDRSAAGYQQWLDLTFLHWRLPPEVLAPLLPPELTIDTWEGDAWLGIVPFRMRNVRPWWCCSVPGVSHFEETNLRTYVHFKGREPGVWFFSLDAARRLAVFLARVGWHLPYHFARMEIKKSDNEIHYLSFRQQAGSPPAHVHVQIELSEQTPQPAAPGSLESFLVDRYLLYSHARNGAIFQGQVFHQPYRITPVTVTHLKQSLTTAVGIAVPDTCDHAVYCPGVDVEVFGLQKVV